MGHPDFRVEGKVFASLWADGRTAVVRLSPSDQTRLVGAHPAVFAPASGAWGSRGYTTIMLRPARVAVVRPAVVLAWRVTAPRSLVLELDGESPHHRG